jgi:hypothetical protein
MPFLSNALNTPEYIAIAIAAIGGVLALIGFATLLFPLLRQEEADDIAMIRKIRQAQQAQAQQPSSTHH